MRRKAFTLIELLVVIAIIAILAAILFPVFAQAKTAAKKAAELSNFKQITTASLIYSGDADDLFPATSVYNFSGQYERFWPYKINPYTKSAEIIRSGLDSRQAKEDPGQGVWLSMASNSFCGGAGGNTVQNDASQGVIALQQGESGWDSFFKSGAVSQTQITKVAETILFGPKYGKDIPKTSFSWIGYNTGATWLTDVFMWDCQPAGNYYCDEGAGIPDGTREAQFGGATRNYPKGNRGGVSEPADNTNGKGSASVNFAFADGHAKSMRAEATNPDPINKPDSNMWNSKR